MLECAKPFYLASKDLYVGCGTCVSCARKRSSSWALRVTKDIEYNFKKLRKKPDFTPAQNSLNGGLYYITLSYSGKYLPKKISEKGKVIRGEGDGFLYRSDLSNFKKRFRERIRRDFGVDGVRILGSGEYGPNNTHRPHFHMIVWNAPILKSADLRELVEKSWSIYDRCSKQYDLIGNIKVEEVVNSGDVASYVAKVSSYVTKNGVSEYCKLPGETNKEFCERTGKLTVPFITASRGIGLDYYTENVEEISRLGFCNSKGFKVSIPRYFLDKMVFYVGRTFYEDKVKRFLKYCSSRGLDLGVLGDKIGCLTLSEYLYHKGYLRSYKRKYRSRVLKYLEYSSVPFKLHNDFLNGCIPSFESCHNLFGDCDDALKSISDFRRSYGDFFDFYSSVVLKEQRYVDLLKASKAVSTYNFLMSVIHEGDSVENIVQRFRNRLEKEKQSACASEFRQRERLFNEACCSFV